MSKLYILVTIAERPDLAQFMNFYEEHKLSVQLITLGMGTANNDMLDYFGLESSDKVVFFSFVTDTTWSVLKPALQRRMQIDVPGKGIAFTVPMSSIAGRRELMFLTQNQDFQKEEESSMKDTAHQLLVIIANHGHSEMIMDAARSAGAAGGTVIHAKGTGMAGAERFLDVTLAAEKEMIFVVVKTELKNAIMSAVTEKAGVATKAGAIVFSLPVESTAGLRLIED